MSRPSEPSGYGVRAHTGLLAPGGVIGDGRYRLLAQFGEDSRAGVQFWRAKDGQLGRDMALSVLIGDPTDTAAAQTARASLDRAAHAATFDNPSLSRIVDVLSLGSGISGTEGVLGLIVSNWIPGTDLVDLVADGPVPPATAAALLEPLTAAVEQAHQLGVVLGVDHPQRIRVSREGSLRLAFPGALPEASLRDDVRGLGALLYLLLTARWPLAGGPEALPKAPQGPDGTLVAPRVLQPGTPPELSSLAIRCLSDSKNSVGGIRTPAALLAVLERVGDENAGDSDTSSSAVDGESGEVWTTKRPTRDPQRRKQLTIALAVLGALTVAVMIWLVTAVISFFSDGSSGGAPELTAGAPTPSVSAPPSGAPSAAPQAGPVKPANASVFNVSGDPDGVDSVNSVIDGNPQTVWQTQNYLQNFPALKPGVGILVTFEQAKQFSDVDIISPSAGSRVQIRTANSPTPNLDDTQVIGDSTDSGLGNGETKLKLAEHKPTKYLLVWVTKLAPANNGFSTSIGEINFVAK